MSCLCFAAGDWRRRFTSCGSSCRDKRGEMNVYVSMCVREGEVGREGKGRWGLHQETNIKRKKESQNEPFLYLPSCTWNGRLAYYYLCFNGL
jgi:hypothetical protein